jgi:D-serine deaminase-like pyridoxal phosphate-dependent protein
LVLRFQGVHAYHGGAQHIRRIDDRRRAAEAAISKAIRAKEICEAVMNSCDVITGGGTGTFGFEGRSGVFTEIQPGSYLVMDRDYGENHSYESKEQPAFEHALFIAATVTGVYEEPSRVVIDAGHKSGAIDCGSPALAPFSLHRLLDPDSRREMPVEVELHERVDESVDERAARAAALLKDIQEEVASLNLREEMRLPYMLIDNGGDDHGVLRLQSLRFAPRGPPHVSLPEDDAEAVKQRGVSTAGLHAALANEFSLGSRMWLVPGHCDPTFNLHDFAFGIRGGLERGSIEEVVMVGARGCQW